MSPKTLWVILFLTLGSVLFSCSHHNLQTSSKQTSVKASQLGLQANDWLWPVAGTVFEVSQFREFPERIGLVTRKGGHVLAVADGEVFFVSDSLDDMGSGIIISHPDNIYSIYGNIDEVELKKGQRVHSGQVLGKVGTKKNANKSLELGVDSGDTLLIGGIHKGLLIFELRRGTQLIGLKELYPKQLAQE